MTPEEIDYAEKIKKKAVEQLAQFLLPKSAKPERVILTVLYRETMAKIEIDIKD